MKARSFMDIVLRTVFPASVSALRMVIGWIFVKEGAGKLFGWFQGGGWEATYGYFKDLGIPFAAFNAYLVGYSELICGIFFIAGLLTRPAAAVIAIIMTVAIFTAHRQGGYNYPLTLLLVCLVFLQGGGGIFSLDFLLSKDTYGNKG